MQIKTDAVGTDKNYRKIVPINYSISRSYSHRMHYTILFSISVGDREWENDPQGN